MLRLSGISTRIAILAGALALAACVPPPSTTRTGPTQQGGTTQPRGTPEAVQAVKVAFLAPTSATNEGAASLGRALVNAARMAEADLGSSGIDLVVMDTAGDPGTAARAARRAIDGGARIILGPLFSASTKAIASTAAANDVKIISFSTDSTVAGDPVFLSGFLPQKEAARVIGYARSRGIRDIGILYPLTVPGEVALRGAQDAAGANLVAVSGFERTAPGIVAGTDDFVLKVRDSGAQGLMVAESGQALVFAMDQLAEKGVAAEEFRFLGLGQWNSRSILGSQRFLNSWFPAPDPAAMDNFVQRYRVRFGEVPPSLAVLGYDAVSIVGQLLEEARATGSRAPFTTAAITRPRGFRGVVGPIRFDRSGMGERGMVILEVGEADFNVIDPAPVVFGAGS